jgi:hypothetical protein
MKTVQMTRDQLCEEIAKLRGWQELETDRQHRWLNVSENCSYRYLPDYLHDMNEAWLLLKADMIFSKRRKFYAELQRLVGNRTHPLIAWPDALGFMEPQDISLAFYFVETGVVVELVD